MRASILFVGLMAGVVGIPAADAQKPERQQEVRVPGVGIMLRAGWQLFLHDGCRFAVPGSWHASADGSQVIAPAGAGSLSVRRFRIVNWSMHKAQIREAFGQLKVLHEDSDRRFWFEFGDGKRITHYIATHDGSSACIGLMEIHPTAAPIVQDTTNRIVDSIGPAPAIWPPGSK